MITNISLFHWGWYFLGLMICPRITFMVFLNYHCSYLPTWFKILGLLFAVFSDVTIMNRKPK
jgi:hypothetical protein